ncbi:uncharacterized protein LOC135653158 isoform X1 [Musa acuminata AAA Group]|uniref:uncharacterized protein LOC135653158 isoform X1 n=1 Tax=Musa acuminata AAA Group TaxID=214697 RepID=UPI0031DF7920
MGLLLLRNRPALMSFDKMPQWGKDRPTRESNRTHLGSIEPVRLPKLSAFDKKYAFGHAVCWACSSSSPLQSRGQRTKLLLAEILRMEGSMAQINHVEGEEEYVLLDLDDVCVRADIPANAPYVLSGLDTAKPVLVIGDLKLIGEYQETMGTCYIFSEGDGAPTVTCSETKPSETNVFKDKQFLDPKQAPSKQVKPIASLHKILKFKLVSEDQNEMAEGVTTSFS